MGNEALALGVVENGCSVATAYPGTPSSEILSSITRFKKENDTKIHTEWSINEKAAFEVALSNSYMGGRSTVSMKQVGLNVALDPLMSASYTGVIGGFIVVSADDPGPHSSQTEQDSRFVAMLAKIPVLDPASPRDAYEMVEIAFELSEKYSIPVMLRPTTRVCHARQNITPGKISTGKKKTKFTKDANRWAATPKFRYILHKELNKKLHAVSTAPAVQPVLYKSPKKRPELCILSSGVAYSHVLDILNDLNIHEHVALYKIPMPYPLPNTFLSAITKKYKKILVVEETYPVIELQIPDRRSVDGKLNGKVPQEGELSPDTLYPIIAKFLAVSARKLPGAKAGGQRPSLCPGCSHRASYFAIRKAFPNAIYTGDIGCYTLGINLGAVDTCLCMGASVNQAAGFYQSFKVNGSEGNTVIATIGDSTFLHSGIPALINAVYNDARFILVILDNSTTAMTGNQPTAATGILPDGSSGKSVHLEKIIEGCGIKYLKTVDPYDIPALITTLKEADIVTRGNDGGISVVIARHPCLMNMKSKGKKKVIVTQDCTGCRYCITNFECPALEETDKRVEINQLLCSKCGVCIHVCPLKAIKIEGT